MRLCIVFGFIDLISTYFIQSILWHIHLARHIFNGFAMAFQSVDTQTL